MDARPSIDSELSKRRGEIGRERRTSALVINE